MIAVARLNWALPGNPPGRFGRTEEAVGAGTT
jgi:hypothetical protein